MSRGASGGFTYWRHCDWQIGYKFKASLSPEQQETLSVATAWYKKHYVDTYREQRARVVQ